jgi:predicted RecA/RadA family phage recombinase
MAKNLLFKDGRHLTVAVAAGTVSGDPVMYGERPGVAEYDRDTDGQATVDFGGVYSLSVKAVDNSGTEHASANVAVAAGDKIYYQAAAGETPAYLSKEDFTGKFFGYAHGTVTSGATAAIPVKVGY